MDRPAGAGFPTERPGGAFTCGWPDGQPCGLPTRPPTGRRLPTSSTGPHHGRWRSTSNTPPAAQASQAPQRPPRRPPTSPSALVPTISTAQPSTEPQIGHVPEIIGHVRRNAQPERAASLSLDIDLAERTDAFVARFGRLQDTLADKLLPALLDWLAEPVAPAIDNLNRAERLGWVQSVELWIEARRLCSRMVHQYVRDPTELALALMAAHGAVQLLSSAADAMAARVLAGQSNRGANLPG